MPLKQQRTVGTSTDLHTQTMVAAHKIPHPSTYSCAYGASMITQTESWNQQSVSSIFSWFQAL